MIFQRCFPTLHFYPRPPRGGRHPGRRSHHHRRTISIHALREEGDGVALGVDGGAVISIHALREEGDAFQIQSFSRWVLFLSTPSARRATGHDGHGAILVGLFLSTPSARRATPCDGSAPGGVVPFLSTPSARRATRSPADRGSPCGISIHALREEGDNRGAVHDVDFQKFLSTPSARRATLGCCGRRGDLEFLSTPSARRATRRIRASSPA